MSIDRGKFFNTIRTSLFHGSMTQSQVDGVNVLLDEWNRRNLSLTNWLAYILATAYWETGQTMQPIREIGHGRGHAYGTRYYGRGYVQLTWLNNYRMMGKRLNIDLVDNPDLALDPKIAASIIYEGMVHGLFTGVGLGHYFTKTKDDWVQARRIVNALDRAGLIAAIGKKFALALNQSHNTGEEK